MNGDYLVLVLAGVVVYFMCRVLGFFDTPDDIDG